MEATGSPRIKRRKLFQGVEPIMLDIKEQLKNYDVEFRSCIGHEIIRTAEARHPLPTLLRRKLIGVACHALMNRTNSDRPSTDQREQLAECIVDQLYSYMSENERRNLKESYFTPSVSYKDQKGKNISKRPMGYIQSFFVNFWRTKKTHQQNKRVERQLVVIHQDNLTSEEIHQIQQWLISNKGPPQKVFEMLNQTFYTRKNYIKTCANFSDIIQNWPRLFDTDGAMQNDFSLSYPLVSENLFFHWGEISTRVLKYAALMKKSITTLGISTAASEENPEVAAFFLLAFMLRGKNKRVSQLGSMDTFIKVEPNFIHVDMNGHKGDEPPQIITIGNKQNLSFQDSIVVFKGKIVKCASLIEAVDLTFKSFYIFNIEFPSACYGAWQFLDSAIYKMKTVSPIVSSVKELTAFVNDPINF